MKHWIQRGLALLGAMLPGTNYLSRLVWLGCISVSLPIFLLGTAYLHVSENKLTQQFQEDNFASLLQLKERMENVLTQIEYQSLQLSIQPSIKAVLGQSDFADHYVEQSEILETLLVQKNSGSMIREVVFYQSASDIAISSGYGATALENSPQRDNIMKVLSMDNKSEWVYLPSSVQDGCISYVRRLPVTHFGKPQGIMIFQVREAEIRKLLFNSGSAMRAQDLLVMDSKNHIMLHSSNDSLLGKPASTQLLLNRVLSAESDTGHFIQIDAQDERLLTVFYRTALGRTYVSLMPEREMTSQLTWLRLFIALSVLIFLLLGVFLTIIFSKLAYSPIDKLLKYGEQLRHGGTAKVPGIKGNEIEFIRSCLTYLRDQAESLDSYVKKIQPDLRDQFLLNLLGSTSIVRKETLDSSCRTYRIPQEGIYLVLVVKAENLFKEKRFLPNEGAIIVFAIKNVMLELLEHSEPAQGFVVEKEEKEAVAILHFDSHIDEHEITRTIQGYADKICEALQTYLSFQVSIGVGGQRDHLARLSESYNEAKLALQYRLISNDQGVLFYNRLAVPTDKLKVFNYPKNFELDMVEYLLQGELSSAEQSLVQFSTRVRTSDSYNTAMQCYLVLLSSIIQSLEEIGHGVLDSLGDNLFEQLKARQTYQEVHEWFVEILFPMHKQITEEIRMNTTKLSVQKVRIHIEANDGLPSLIECAELVNMSPSYLSRMFKQEAGISFIEYLMKYKVEKARKLLEETDHSITEVASMVGYSERNLNRAFQRHVAMSPKQYRLSTR
ncbi:Helix-turn-helix domain-containing protein [Paenibacillus sp. 1_12]|uniref:helix-turn-helix domain-containing protein n=1 Tax=Paenibacillus sp. 1_12 TaxID=1566278 RepID=UPI0008F19424|nr:helix-turn-helix domain-containing protein [Paenibacillus sp. 1_12]SFM14444.1 Helix-turn-helix domain-containing protein [Paenibacillus sp. 1_12]